MKLLLVLFLFISGIIHSQNEFNFPLDFYVDPLILVDSNFKVRKVEQFHVTYNETMEDSITILDYILKYDSNGRITSFYYNFNQVYELNDPFSDSHNRSFIGLFNLQRVEQFIYMLDTLYFTYDEYLFHYDSTNNISFIERLSGEKNMQEGKVDGYLKPLLFDKIEMFYFEKLMNKRIYYLNGIEYFTECFNYEEITVRGNCFKLLSRISVQYPFQKQCFYLKYYP